MAPDGVSTIGTIIEWTTIIFINVIVVNICYQNTDDSELAILVTALLSSNVKIALDCVQLRSWEGGLYTIMLCMMDRMEDDVLYRFNNYRRTVTLVLYNIMVDLYSLVHNIYGPN
jgi:hypothetical protein